MNADNSITVTIKYTDNKDDGLTKRDNANSCLYGELFRHSPNYKYEVADSSLITSTFDELRGYRLWSFNIPAADIRTKLVTTSRYEVFWNNNSSFFKFKIQLKSDLTIYDNPEFTGAIQKDDATCVFPNNCITKAKSSVQFCIDSACSAPASTIPIYEDKSFWVLQTITQDGFEAFDLKYSIVTLNVNYFSGISQYNMEPISTTNKPGQLIIELIMPVEITNFTITIDSILAAPKGRLLIVSENKGFPISAHALAESAAIECFMIPVTEACASGSDKCKINEYTNDDEYVCEGGITWESDSYDSFEYTVPSVIGLIILGVCFAPFACARHLANCL